MTAPRRLAINKYMPRAMGEALAAQLAEVQATLAGLPKATDISGLQSQVTALSNQLAALQSLVLATQVRVGSLTLPLILLGGTNTQTLTWSTPMPSATYDVYIGIESILGSGTAIVTAKTAQSVTIKTTANALITAGARILVTAWNL